VGLSQQGAKVPGRRLRQQFHAGPRLHPRYGAVVGALHARQDRQFKESRLCEGFARQRLLCRHHALDQRHRALAAERIQDGPKQRGGLPGLDSVLGRRKRHGGGFSWVPADQGRSQQGAGGGASAPQIFGVPTLVTEPP
ncbi:MAG: hypothetical protein ACK55I_37540, partial [bacterium]